MKKIITILICLVLTSNIAFGQLWINFNFDQDTNYKKYFYIDSSNVNNKWQVGKPQKTIFNAAKSVPNALVTDTLNSYPVNDTSSVIIFHKVHSTNHAIRLTFEYKINSDTLTDYGKVDISVDNGQSWLHCNTNGWQNYYIWQGQMPTFTGSHGWHYSTLDIFPTYPMLFTTGDTVLFRFTFISDNFDNPKDGWMIDDMVCFEWISHIDEFSNTMPFNIFYNGNNEICIVRQDYAMNTENTHIQISDLTGRIIFEFGLTDDNTRTYKVPDIAEGVYLYAIQNQNSILQSGKILVK